MDWGCDGVYQEDFADDSLAYHPCLDHLDYDRENRHDIHHILDYHADEAEIHHDVCPNLRANEIGHGHRKAANVRSLVDHVIEDHLEHHPKSRLVAIEQSLACLVRLIWEHSGLEAVASPPTAQEGYLGPP